jgi:hypothetical protein
VSVDSIINLYFIEIIIKKIVDVLSETLVNLHGHVSAAAAAASSHDHY